jgi:acyl-coenzyme A thioesterase PaaI-like protein
LSFACEFLAAVRQGELIEGRCEITRAGNSIIFLRGMLTSADRPVFSFSGSIKRIAQKLPINP